MGHVLLDVDSALATWDKFGYQRVKVIPVSAAPPRRPRDSLTHGVIKTQTRAKKKEEKRKQARCRGGKDGPKQATGSKEGVQRSPKVHEECNKEVCIRSQQRQQCPRRKPPPRQGGI